MHSRLSLLIAAVLALTAFGGITGAASARHGADDPAGHLRHSQGADDTKAERRAHRHRRHGHGARHHAGHAHRRHGADDAPNHG